MKEFVFKTLFFSFVLLCLFGCKHDKKDEKDVAKEDEVNILFPSSNFGGDYKAINDEEAKRGCVITKNENLKTLKATFASEKVEFTYYFNEKAQYQVAVCELKTNLSLSKFEDTLKTLGFTKDDSASKNEKEKVFINKEKKITLAISLRKLGEVETLSYSFGNLDETVFSWTRVSQLKHESGLYIPLIAKGAPKDLMERFESRLGHSMNASSKTNQGVYIFDTNEQKFPKIKYWFDVKNKAFLEETAIFVNPDDRPTPQQVDAFLTTNGYKLTPLVDDVKNQMYYNKKVKSIAIVEMNKPKAGVFEPKIQFIYSNIDEKLPKELVDMPIPILEFGKITLDEALEKFKKEAYYDSHETNPIGGYNIITKSEDFPKIWIDQDGGKYALACDIAKDAKVINSDDIVTKLKTQGFTEKGAATIETYINRTQNVMAQIDRKATFGAECVAFSANEY